MSVRLTVVVLCAVISFGCQRSAEAPTEAPRRETDQERRERLREALRAELGDQYDAPLPAATPEDLERGAKLYDMVCASCHGRTGRGNGRSARLLTIRPPDLSDPAVVGFFSDRAKLEIIARGLEGTPMIGWQDMLDEEDRLDVLQFMNSLRRQGADGDPGT